MIRHDGPIFMVRDPVDMRKGLEGLSGVVRLLFTALPRDELVGIIAPS